MPIKESNVYSNYREQTNFYVLANKGKFKLKPDAVNKFRQWFEKDMYTHPVIFCVFFIIFIKDKFRLLNVKCNIKC